MQKMSLRYFGNCMRTNRKISVFLIAALAIVGMWLHHNSAPTYLKGINYHSAENVLSAEITARLLVEFRLGSSEAVLEARLDRDRFYDKYIYPNGFRSRTYRRWTSLTTRETTVIDWKADDYGNLIELRGGGVINRGWI
jgi:hypothetical protein